MRVADRRNAITQPLNFPPFFLFPRIPLTKSQHYTDGLSRYGRFSPNLDQGYHTLVSPSPSGQQQSTIPASWTTGGTHGSGGGTNSTSSSHGSPAQTNTPVGGNGGNANGNGPCGRSIDGATILTSLGNGHGTSLYRAGPLFDRMPDELMVRIFEWLDSSELCNIARVCRRFESVIWNPALWKIIKIKGTAS